MPLSTDVTKHFHKYTPHQANELSHFLYCITFTSKLCVGGAAYILMKELNFQYCLQ